MVALRNLQLDVRRAVKAIQRVFSAQGDLEEAEAEELHELFVTCIEQVNVRLQKCDDLLRRGLRQEALQECESEPSILDLVTELDVPEWEAWAHYAGQFGLPAQPGLLIEVAAELNAEFTTAASLDSLLRKHRLHALARSPLSVRLTLLRSIAERDPSNHIWKEDVAAFETARLRQVGNDFRQRFDAQDLPGVEALRRELESRDWQTAPPAAVVEPVVRGHVQLVRADARARLTALAGEIDKQFAAFDLPAVRRAHEQWERYAPLGGLTSQDELSQRVAQAFAWLEQERRTEESQFEFQTAVGELESALDLTSTSRHELERLRTVAERFDQPIPERVSRRCDERLRAIQRAEQRRFHLLAGAVAGSILLVGVFLVLVIRWQMASQEIRQAEEAIRRLVEGQSYREAQAMLDKLPDKVRRVAVIEGLAADISAKVRADAARKERFFAQLNAVRQGLTETWDSVKDSQQRIEEAATIASQEDERTALAELKGVVSGVRDKLQSAVDDEFMAECKLLVGSLSDLEKWEESAIRDRLTTAEALAKRAYVSQTAKESGQIELIVTRLKSRDAALRTTGAERRARNNVVSAVDRKQLFVSAVRDYIKANAGDRAADFQRAVDESVPALDVVAAWNQLAGAWPADGWKSPTSARAILVALDKNSEFAAWQSIAKAAALRQFLEGVAKRDSGPDSVWQELSDYLNKEWMQLWCVRNKKKGELVYFSVLPGDPIKSSLGLSYKVNERVSVLDADEVKSTRLYLPDLEPTKDGEYVLPSPQRVFAQRAIERLKFMQGPKASLGYEEYAVDLLSAWMKQNGVDPILRMRFLQDLHAVLTDASLVLKEALRPLELAMATAEPLVGVNWLDRGDATSTKRQDLARQATEIEAGDASPTKLKSAVLARLEEAKQALERPPVYAWVGVLLKNDAGQWQCQVPKHVENAIKGDLFLFDSQAERGSPFQRIGKAGADGPVLDLELSSQFYQGRPVFCLK